jgi:hypothetical protein
VGTRLVRITHPFHPLSGRQLVCVGERYNRYGPRLLLRVDEERVCSVPRQWTDVVAPDLEIVIGEGRALLRVSELVGLAELVARLAEEDRRPQRRKGNGAAFVRETVPLAGPRAREIKEFLVLDLARGLDNDRRGGVMIRTIEPETPCPSEPTAKTRRPQPSSRRAR